MLKFSVNLNYIRVRKLLSWIFPTKKDRDEFRSFCNAIEARKHSINYNARYQIIIKKLQQDIKTRKIKVVFLSSEISKWAYQDIYELLEKDSRFDVKILILREEGLVRNNVFSSEYDKKIQENYKYFKSKGFNVEYAFDLRTKKYQDLRNFQPDLVFYEQPWGLTKKYKPDIVSEYALTFYCSYGACISNGENEYIEFFKEIFVYFLDNKFIVEEFLLRNFNDNTFIVCGKLKLDSYLKYINQNNIIWKTQNKKRVIYAPHHSFGKNNVQRLGTFDWNYQFFYELAKNNPEVEFILKPHPTLIHKIVYERLLSEHQTIDYFDKWSKLPNAQIYDGGNYFDMFRTSDLLITDCNSFLYEYLPTKNPVIHLIGEHSVGHNEFGRKIISGYYPARTIEELQMQLDLVLFQGKDPLLPVRERVIKDNLCQPEEGTAQFIVNYINKVLEGN